MQTNARPDLPRDLVEKCLTFLPPDDLLSCGLVNTNWRDASEQDQLWEIHAHALWQSKANCVPGVSFRYALYNPVAVSSVKDLKEILKARRIDAGKFVEKQEFRQAIARSDDRIRGLFVGKPPMLRGKWKASYFYSIKDAKRTKMTDEELWEAKWVFFFKSNPHQFTSIATFSQPNVFTMDPFPMMNTQFLNYVRDGNGSVQIHHFPAHHLSRDPDTWGWIMQNEHVIFFQEFGGFDQSQALKKIEAQMYED